MSIGAPVIVSDVLIGVGATVAMDLWNLLLKRGLGIASLNYCLAAAICRVDCPSAYIATIRSRIRIGWGSIAGTYRKHRAGAIGRRALL